MTDHTKITQETFIRFLPYNVCLQLATHLDVGDLWEELVSVIPKNPNILLTDTNDNYDLRYNNSQIQNLSSRNTARGKSCTRALIVDWGRQNVTVKHLIQALKRARLTAASDFLISLLGEGPTEPLPQPQLSTQITDIRRIDVSYPSSSDSCYNVKIDHECYQNKANTETGEDNLASEARRISISSTGQMDDVKCSTSINNVSDINQGTPPVKEEITLKDVQFEVLKKITNNFDVRTVKEGGKLIGSGGFGKVFLGTFHTGFQIAVKLLISCSEDDIQSQFKNEVETLCKYKHENLVLLLGYSVDGDNRCLIYQYMCNGSLEDRLACNFNTPPLQNNLRFHIAKGTASGIEYLHEGGLIHRDIKSANILLDAKFNPKVGDFATARVSPKGETSTLKTSVIIGTQSYLAPEAFSFVVHPGLDVFSYGVVLLEILTGLPVMDPHREDQDLKIHVQELCTPNDEGEAAGTIYDILDTKGGNWDSAVVDALYSISCRCQEVKQKRPKMAAILAELEALELTDVKC
uniref:non-specific serine/threonine protein kinase n=1 Tax=Biomphalaria glabrata TaxID=6526 RepID=A0A2C9KR81_BIOGL